MCVKTKFNVSDDIIEKTNCENDFSCINNTDCSLNCRVKNTIGDICILEAGNIFSCNKIVFFGNEYVCNCPTRAEIFKKLKI
ncbi:MAG: hypothetical protein GXO49_07060 [Chlorobi bacterium]|nr:hypothetical protein [Chlorobiota bacterium]